MKKNCFVTVGSTQFERLVQTVLSDEVLRVLSEIGFNSIVIQNGSGKVPEFLCLSESADGERWEKIVFGIKIELFRYADSISDKMKAAYLVIGHAGAGTCLEVLELGKPFVAVINDALMDGHQSELAEKLAADKYLLCTIPGKLAETLRTLSPSQLVTIPKRDVKIFSQFMKELLLVHDK